MDSKAIVSLKSELDLFSALPVQLAIEESSFLEIHPVASLNNASPIEFYISGNGEHYLDLSHTILHLQLKVTKKNGADMEATDKVAPINYILNTMFSECSVFLNDKQIASQPNYAYRSIIEALLFASRSVHESLFTSSLFYKDTASHHNVVDTAGANEGLKSRYARCSSSRVLDLVGGLHIDISSQPKALINGVDVRIKLERNKDSFALMCANDTFKLAVLSAKLYVRKLNVAPSIILGQEKALEKGVIKMPIRRVEVKTFALSSGLQSSTIANAFIGQLPSRVIMGFVSNAAYNGRANKNPFNFQHYDLTYLCMLNQGKMLPARAFTPDFANDKYARSYLSLFTDLGRYHNSQNININYDEYKNGYTLFAFDLTPDMAANESHTSINKNGNIGIDIKFGAALPETVTVVVFAEYRNTVEIDKSRGVFTDF